MGVVQGERNALIIMYEDQYKVYLDYYECAHNLSMHIFKLGRNTLAKVHYRYRSIRAQGHITAFSPCKIVSTIVYQYLM